MKRILFICKRNENYGQKHCWSRHHSGLFNSTRFIVEALVKKGIDAKIIDVHDNNDIDREVYAFKPNIVVIEALWVVPEKFPILKKLHPKVHWFIHLHSEIPFLAYEGIATDWIKRYVHQGIKIIANSKNSFEALKTIVPPSHLIHLPNVYLPKDPTQQKEKDKSFVDIACFGAIRPLKNQLLQGMAALKFAKDVNKLVRFHINVPRVETGGEPILKNLRNLFRHSLGQLIEHPWHEPEKFLNILVHMDLGMQVSLSETFNVVAADYVTANVPIVISKEIYWASETNMADASDINEIVSTMHSVINDSLLVCWNRWLLNRFSKRAQRQWHEFVKQHG